MSWYQFKPYVSVAKRQANARKEVAALAKKGRTVSPVNIDGRTIARTFWGKSWCDHLESYSDFANRLPRGRTYVRNGSVVDLQIGEGTITAMVSGSSLYTVTIGVKPLATSAWKGICQDCAGRIGSLIELLKGQFGTGVMEIVTRKPGGMFPAPTEIDMDCSCPDWAGMCKHIAATLYGVGARLDHQPQLLFTLRQVDHFDLLAGAGDAHGLARAQTGQATIADESLSEVFGIDLAPPAPVVPATSTRQPITATAATRGKKPKRAPARVGRESGSQPSRKATSKPKPTPTKKAKPKKRPPGPEARASTADAPKARRAARGRKPMVEPDNPPSQPKSPKRRAKRASGA